MSLSMPLPNCNKSLLVDALLLGEPSGSSGGEDPSGMQCLTLTNCGITLMAFCRTCAGGMCQDVYVQVQQTSSQTARCGKYCDTSAPAVGIAEGTVAGASAHSHCLQFMGCRPPSGRTNI